MHSDHVPTRGLRLGITFAGEAVVGEVIWTKRPFFGVRLLTPLQDDDVLRIIARIEGIG